MNKYLLSFIVGLFVAQGCASAAITVKKASSVAKKETSVQNVGGSLLPTALTLFQTVKQLNQQQQELSAECEPSTQEVNWVNKMIKEWAKSGGVLPKDDKIGGMAKCNKNDNSYSKSIQNNIEYEEDICYEVFDDDSDKGMIWQDYPKVTTATYYIVDGEYSATGKRAKDKRVASNIYDIFNLIDFTTEDYTAEDAKMVAKLNEKMEKCAPAKLSAKKAAMWGDFVMGAVGSIGQNTNTGSLMETVSGLVSSGGGMSGALQSLGGVATSLLDK